MDDAAPLTKADMAGALYERDYHAWALTQAALLRAGRLGEADIDNIAEEIDSLGRSEQRELSSRLTVILLHLLKWQFQPMLQSRSWQATIQEQRSRLDDHLEENPSLRAKAHGAITIAYRRARAQASIETGLLTAAFPDDCPWSEEQIMDRAFWPSA